MRDINTNKFSSNTEIEKEDKLEIIIEGLYSSNKLVADNTERKKLIEIFSEVRDKKFLLYFIEQCTNKLELIAQDIANAKENLKNDSVTLEKYMEYVRGVEKKPLYGDDFLTQKIKFENAQKRIVNSRQTLEKYEKTNINLRTHITNFLDCAKHQLVRIEDFDIPPITRPEKYNDTNISSQTGVDKIQISAKILGNNSEVKNSLEAEKERIRCRIKAVEEIFSKETRDIASILKKELPRNHFCPYCGKELGNDAHADHIVPVSQGGRSVTTNMVMVCASCNLKKSDLTLREFIIKEHLDRDLIELRLEKLKKRF